MESIRGIILNPPLSGNIKICKIGLTVLKESMQDVNLVCVHCQMLSCHFLINVRSSFPLSGRTTAPVGANCRVLVRDQEDATRDKER